MQIDKSGSDVLRAFDGRNYNPSQRILDTLKTIDGQIRQIIEQRVAVVKFGRNKSIGKENGRVKIEGRTNLTKQANLIEGGAASIRDVVIER